jgi:ribA/ribD-fused uncharacterized protein
MSAPASAPSKPAAVAERKKSAKRRRAVSEDSDSDEEEQPKQKKRRTSDSKKKSKSAKSAKSAKTAKPKKQRVPFRQTDDVFLFKGGWASQWSASPFELDEMKFGTAEQAMMVFKAIEFKDDEMRTVGSRLQIEALIDHSLACCFPKKKPQAILAEKNAFKQKQLGRRVRNFDSAQWDRVARELVYKINLAKYQQNAKLAELLLATGTRRIVEASKRDKRWGIGLDVLDTLAEDPAQWRGTNWLGEALERVRATLRQ